MREVTIPRLLADNSGGSFAYRLARQALPKAIRHRLGEWVTAGQTRCSPDRVYLHSVLLPRIICRGGPVLLVGCRRYTVRDPYFIQQHGVICWTLDIDPAAALWGLPGCHIVAPMEQAASRFDPAMFNTVVLSGVFGFGLNEVVAQEEAITACATILRPSGLLVLGWNTNRVVDPSTLHSLRRDFKPSDDVKLVGRVTFRHCTHVFDFYTRRDVTSTTQPGLSP